MQIDAKPCKLNIYRVSFFLYTLEKSIKVALQDITDVKVTTTNWFYFWLYAAAGLVTFSIILALIYGDSHSGNKM